MFSIPIRASNAITQAPVYFAVKCKKNYNYFDVFTSLLSKYLDLTPLPSTKVRDLLS